MSRSQNYSPPLLYFSEGEYLLIIEISGNYLELYYNLIPLQRKDRLITQPTIIPVELITYNMFNYICAFLPKNGDNVIIFD
jgi:hypothetical protein